jgi:hypothetical protein
MGGSRFAAPAPAKRLWIFVGFALQVPRCGGEELQETTNDQPQAQHRENEHRKRRHRFESGRYAIGKVELAQSHPGSDEKNCQRPHHPDARLKNRPHLHGCGYVSVEGDADKNRKSEVANRVEKRDELLRLGHGRSLPDVQAVSAPNTFTVCRVGDNHQMMIPWSSHA